MPAMSSALAGAAPELALNRPLFVIPPKKVPIPDATMAVAGAPVEVTWIVPLFVTPPEKVDTPKW